jgi:hypothetical protein
MAFLSAEEISDVALGIIHGMETLGHQEKLEVLGIAMRLVKAGERAEKLSSQLVMDLHKHAYALWARNTPDHKKRLPVKDAALREFLQQYVPPSRVNKIIEMAEHHGLLQRSKSPPGWIPKLPV